MNDRMIVFPSFKKWYNEWLIFAVENLVLSKKSEKPAHMWKIWGFFSGVSVALESITHFWHAKALDQLDKSNCLKSISQITLDEK